MRLMLFTLLDVAVVAWCWYIALGARLQHGDKTSQIDKWSRDNARRFNRHNTRKGIK